jgi:hypothetical protein
MKHLKKIYAIIAVVVLSSAAVVWAAQEYTYNINNHTSHNLGTVTVEFFNGPSQYVNVSGTGNYVIDNPGNMSGIVVNGTRVLVGASGTAYSGTSPILVSSTSTTGWDINETN